VLEGHSLDHMMQAMANDMNKMDSSARKQLELNPTGRWRVLCGMRERARDTLGSARWANEGIMKRVRQEGSKSDGDSDASGDEEASNKDPESKPPNNGARHKAADGKSKKARKESDETHVLEVKPPTTVDFAAMQAQLHAEVEAALRAKEEQKSLGGGNEENTQLVRKEKKRKRNRNSDGTQAVIMSPKKQKYMLEAKPAETDVAGGTKDRKRKADEFLDRGKTKKLKAGA
jgi:hypothetical protein